MISRRPVDTLALASCIAVLAHASLILGVGFSLEDDVKAPSPALEVILVQNRSEAAADEADYLAQADLQGGGDLDHKESPSTPLNSPFPEQEPNIATADPVFTAQDPPPQQAQTPAAAWLSSRDSARGKAEKTSKERTGELMLEKPAAYKPLSERAKQAAKQPPEKQLAVESEETLTEQLPGAAILMRNALAMASLNAEIEQRLSMKAKTPRRKFVSANTREYKFAAYMEAWRAKVERVGNLNYPEEARRRKLIGNLILDVALRSDGRVVEMTLRRSSGQSILDQAAMRIVELASPFARFPDAIREEVDILHITRTWQFLYSQRFASE